MYKFVCGLKELTMKICWERKF